MVNIKNKNYWKEESRSWKLRTIVTLIGFLLINWLCIHTVMERNQVRDDLRASENLKIYCSDKVDWREYNETSGLVRSREWGEWIPLSTWLEEKGYIIHINRVRPTPPNPYLEQTYHERIKCEETCGELQQNKLKIYEENKDNESWIEENVYYINPIWTFKLNKTSESLQ